MLFVLPNGLTGVMLISINVILFHKVMNSRNDTYSNRKDGFMRKFQQSDYRLQFERVNVVSFDKKLLKKFEIVTFKRNRTSAAINVSWTLQVDFNDEAEVIFQAYRFASNEYRLFPMRFQLNFCDALQANILGFNSFFQCGNFTGCPLKKGVAVFICNWSPNQFRFPPFIPTGKYMLEMQALLWNTEICVFRGYGDVFRPFGEN